MKRRLKILNILEFLSNILGNKGLAQSFKSIYLKNFS